MEGNRVIVRDARECRRRRVKMLQASAWKKRRIESPRK